MELQYFVSILLFTVTTHVASQTTRDNHKLTEEGVSNKVKKNDDLYKNVKITQTTNTIAHVDRINEKDSKSDINSSNPEKSGRDNAIIEKSPGAPTFNPLKTLDDHNNFTRDNKEDNLNDGVNITDLEIEVNENNKTELEDKFYLGHFHNYYEHRNPHRKHYSNSYHPGVLPDVYEDDRPPYTNKPINRPFTEKPNYAKPLQNNENRKHFYDTPELLTGNDEDDMSKSEKRRYVEIAERMCEKYKALDYKKVQAIALLPEPDPVEFNISSCLPSNLPLIVGGKATTVEEFPHMVLVGWHKLEEREYSWKCGGSLVSELWVLTAAHCALQDKDTTVVSGPPQVVQLGSSYVDDPDALIRKISSVIRHPKYRSPRSYYDLALMKMASSVRFSKAIRPACLGTPPPPGNEVVVTGWGQTEYGEGLSFQLRCVSMPLWRLSDCSRVLGTSSKLPNGPGNGNLFCAGEKKGGKDTCQGDSGGPAQIQDGCAWRVVGVTAVGRGCGAPNTPGLYAVVQIPFISSHVFPEYINLYSHRSEGGRYY